MNNFVKDSYILGTNPMTKNLLWKVVKHIPKQQTLILKPITINPKGEIVVLDDLPCTYDIMNDKAMLYVSPSFGIYLSSIDRTQAITEMQAIYQKLIDTKEKEIEGLKKHMSSDTIILKM